MLPRGQRQSWLNPFSVVEAINNIDGAHVARLRVVVCSGGQPMPQRALSQTSLIAGVLIVLVSALADQIGIGQYPGFGWRQVLGIVLGLVLVWRGFMWRRNP